MDKKFADYINFEAQEDFEKILTNPILDIAARVWDKDRYDAFRICYRSMRIIDDLVDDKKSELKKLTDSDKEYLENIIDSWTDALKKRDPIDDFQDNLILAMEKFKIPDWPWVRLSKAMIYDLHHDGFETFLIFRRYTEGAAIAPASIFMHLCGLSKTGNDYQAPSFDIRRKAMPLALFSYLVHIMRDFEKDQNESLNYYADNLVKKYDLDNAIIRQAALKNEITDNLRRLFSDYHQKAGYYRNQSQKMLEQLLPTLDSKYALSLNIIFALYDQIYKRIDIKNGDFSIAELNPTPAEISSLLAELLP